MFELSEILLVVVPIVIVEIVLGIIALLGIFKLYGCRNGNKTLWALIVIFVQIIGPILYFAFGKGEGIEQKV